MANQNTFHENYSKRDDVSPSSNRSFGIVFTAAFAVIGLWPVISGTEIRWWSIAIAGAFLVAALTRPSLLSPLNRLWTQFGLLLGRITSPLLMGLIFFLVVTPIGLTMRLLGKRTLDLKYEPNAESYWIKREPPGPAPETMKNQF